jgi:hypothetical protein
LHGIRNKPKVIYYLLIIKYNLSFQKYCWWFIDFFFVNRWSRFPQKFHYSLDDIQVHSLFLIKLISTYCGTNISMVVLVYWNYHMIWLYFAVLMIFQVDRQDSFLM